MTLLLQYTLLYASVLILVALGGCFSERSGVINLGLEGIMVMGALGGALTMKYMTGLPGIVIVLTTILVSALFAGFSEKGGNHADDQTHEKENRGAGIAVKQETKEL